MLESATTPRNMTARCEGNVVANTQTINNLLLAQKS